jgi:ferredoxin-NADP reductase
MAVELEGRLERVVEHGADTRSLFVRLPVPLAFRPGQFISCLLPVDGATLIRPYSIASSPEEAEQLELLLDHVPGGPGSSYLCGLSAGATLRFTGPWGTFVLDRAPAAETVFVADGTAIAPIRPMLKRALASRPTHPLRLLYGVASPERVLYRGEFEALARAQTLFTFEPVASVALREEVARRYVTADADRSRHFFICGVGGIVPALRDLLRHAGYVRRAVQYEKW